MIEGTWKKPSGCLVTTTKGYRGRTYFGEELVNGKQIVHLIDKRFQPIRDIHGKPQKLLCNPAKLSVHGYFD